MSATATDEQQLLIEAAREFARGELLERDRAWDRDGGSMAEVLPELGAMGMLNLLVPEELGGLGCSYRIYADILHEIAYASPSVAVALSVHNMVGHILQEYASEPNRTEWLAQWGMPESFSAFAITEAGAGSDPGASTTEARKVEGGYRVSGEKMWISNGLAGRWFLTLARTNARAGKAGLSALLVDGNESGFGRDEIHGKTGIRGSETAVIHYDDVFVPDAHLVGAEGAGLKVCLSALDCGRIGIASQATGISEACLDEMVSYAKQREQFNHPIAAFQAIQTMLADSAVELAAARALVHHAADLVDAGQIDPSASAKAKLFASEAANRTAYRAVQIHGGSGYVNEFRVEQLARDARVTTIYEGTSEIQRIVIARDLLQEAD
ncbi:MAG: acyl-CoA dehydrogenase [bacterium]|nr:acyl-CoA dehydrogenase [bacterium]